MALTRLDLPGSFDEQKSQLIRGSTMLAWRKNLLRDRIICGEGMQEIQMPYGRILSVKPAPQYGAFWGVFPYENGMYLQGGVVSGGGGSETVADIKVLGDGINSAGLLGYALWLKIDVRGNLVDGVILPGAEVTSVSCSVGATSGFSIPDENLPTVASVNGSICVELGRWRDTGFAPAQIGHIQVSYCPGNFTITRS